MLWCGISGRDGAARVQNLDLLLHPMLDAESRVLAQTRVTECERVLAGLDAGIAGHQDAI